MPPDVPTPYHESRLQPDNVKAIADRLHPVSADLLGGIGALNSTPGRGRLVKTFVNNESTRDQGGVDVMESVGRSVALAYEERLIDPGEFDGVSLARMGLYSANDFSEGELGRILRASQQQTIGVKGVLDTNRFGTIDTTEDGKVTFGMIDVGAREKITATMDLSQI